MSFPEIKTEDLPERYQINVPFVVYETFADQETAIINLKTGNYYSLNISGAEIWEEIAKNIDVNEVINNILAYQEGNPEIIHNSIQNFIANLKNEDLIVDFNETTEISLSAKSPREIKEKIPFVAPVIEGYTDMQELLLLDPIHDVDETGFPNARQQ